MNKKQLRKNIGKDFRIRPFVERRDLSNQKLRRRDDYWRLEKVNDNAVELKNITTDHVKTLQFDNIHEFRSPDFLCLRCQIILQGRKVIIEPIIIRNSTSR